MAPVTGEVKVEGQAEHVDFQPYAVTSTRNGAGSVLTFEVRDGPEFIRVLQAILVHGLEITHARLRA